MVWHLVNVIKFGAIIDILSSSLLSFIIAITPDCLRAKQMHLIKSFHLPVFFKIWSIRVNPKIYQSFLFILCIKSLLFVNLCQIFSFIFSSLCTIFLSLLISFHLEFAVDSHFSLLYNSFYVWWPDNLLKHSSIYITSVLKKFQQLPCLLNTLHSL